MIGPEDRNRYRTIMDEAHDLVFESDVLGRESVEHFSQRHDRLPDRVLSGHEEVRVVGLVGGDRPFDGAVSQSACLS
jgi:hypothetical protein